MADGVDFEHLLKETGLSFVPVPGRPSVSFKLPGAETPAVDLLGAYAQAIPLLDFLVGDAIDSVVLSPNQVIPVKIPSPEHFLLHKLYSSQSRKADRDKVRKDLQQAAVLAAALVEETPGTLREALRRIPSAQKPVVKRGARAAAKILEPSHPEAEEALRELAGK